MLMINGNGPINPNSKLVQELAIFLGQILLLSFWRNDFFGVDGLVGANHQLILVVEQNLGENKHAIGYGGLVVITHIAHADVFVDVLQFTDTVQCYFDIFGSILVFLKNDIH